MATMTTTMTAPVAVPPPTQHAAPAAASNAPLASTVVSLNMRTGLELGCAGSAFHRGFSSRIAHRTRLTRSEYQQAIDDLNDAVRRATPAWLVMLAAISLCLGFFVVLMGGLVYAVTLDAYGRQGASKILLVGTGMCILGGAILLAVRSRFYLALEFARGTLADVNDRLRPQGVDWELLDRQEWSRRYGTKTEHQESGNYKLVVRRLQSSMCGAGSASNAATTSSVSRTASSSRTRGGRLRAERHAMASVV
eukprot:TRINITY_DN6391_c0_g3_i1.p1 TRINITY_DN6391_c0_g3~~TRINITY_DN6391_c0_g3_i1.p1  ORF type:complete len:251 (+),score=19.40 TRINITY_DN6391_c0_g3_i1:46-798(+)